MVDAVWDDLFPLERNRIVRLLLKSVTVGVEGMRIEIDAEGVHSLISEMTAEGATAYEPISR